jgi:hypothetical protein
MPTITMPSHAVAFATLSAQFAIDFSKMGARAKNTLKQTLETMYLEVGGQSQPYAALEMLEALRPLPFVRSYRYDQASFKAMLPPEEWEPYLAALKLHGIGLRTYPGRPDLMRFEFPNDTTVKERGARDKFRRAIERQLVKKYVADQLPENLRSYRDWLLDAITTGRTVTHHKEFKR